MNKQEQDAYSQEALLKSDQELADEFRQHFFKLGSVFRRLCDKGYCFNDSRFLGMEDRIGACFAGSGEIEIYRPSTSKRVELIARVDL